MFMPVFLSIAYFVKGVQKMYEIFDKLRKERGVSVYRISKETGVSQATFSAWKAGEYTPKTDKMQKIAQYFNVSVDYLLGKEQQPEQKTSDLTEKERRDVARDVQKIMSNLEESGDLMFDGVPMSEAARASMAAAMRIGLEEARRRNKETYTPKKYKKG